MFRLPPVTQATLISLFTMLSTGLYCGAALLFDRSMLPRSGTYWGVFALLYLSCWISFIPALKRLTRRILDPINRGAGVIAGALRWLGKEALRALRWLSDVTAQDGSLGRANPKVSLRESFSLEMVEVAARARFPLNEAVRVQTLGVGTAVLAAWMTHFSGGPLTSPYAQVLLALPLLSPVVAYTPWSILGVYGATALSVVLFEWIWPPITHAPEQPAWYGGVLIWVLVVSAFVSFNQRARQIRHADGE